MRSLHSLEKTQLNSFTRAKAQSSNNEHMLMQSRLVAASFSLLMSFFVAENERFHVGWMQCTLLLYILYSIALYKIHIIRNEELIEFLLPYIEVVIIEILVVLSSGSESIYFIFFLIPIYCASIQGGFRNGLQITLFSMLVFVNLGLILSPGWGEEKLQNLLLRSVWLVIFGFLIARWGHIHIQQQRRFGFLKGLSNLSNPRFGVDRTLSSALEQLCAFYEADSCLLITVGPGKDQYRLRQIGVLHAERSLHSEAINPELGQAFLSLRRHQAVVYSSQPSWLWKRGGYSGIDLRTRENVPFDESHHQKLVTLLGTTHFISVPTLHQGDQCGRVFLTSSHRCFDHSDIDFIEQVVNQLMPLVKNIELVDRLASEAAEEERYRIARDIHDSIIQPYIGLQMGIDAMLQKVEQGESNLTQSLQQLNKMCIMGTVDLRAYVEQLKGGRGQPGNLVPAVQRFAIKFSNATNIKVRVQADPDIRLHDRLAAEVFQMVAEGLSNIRRHTQADQASIELARQNGHLILRMENPGNMETTGSNEFGAADGLTYFIPLSLSERAQALGGQIQTKVNSDGGAVVTIEIPL